MFVNDNYEDRYYPKLFELSKNRGTMFFNATCFLGNQLTNVVPNPLTLENIWKDFSNLFFLTDSYPWIFHVLFFFSYLVFLNKVVTNSGNITKKSLGVFIGPLPFYQIYLGRVIQLTIAIPKIPKYKGVMPFLIARKRTMEIITKIIHFRKSCCLIEVPFNTN